MVTQRNLLKRKTPKRFIMKHFGVLQVVPPGIVINTQAALYLHFKESQPSQSPPIAPPQNCPILRIAEADDFLLAKVQLLDEKSKGLG